jgi:hypothetical protein
VGGDPLPVALHDRPAPAHRRALPLRLCWRAFAGPAVTRPFTILFRFGFLRCLFCFMLLAQIRKIGMIEPLLVGTTVGIAIVIFESYERSSITLSCCSRVISPNIGSDKILPWLRYAFGNCSGRALSRYNQLIDRRQTMPRGSWL